MSGRAMGGRAMGGRLMGALALVWVVAAGLFLGGPVGFALLGLGFGLGPTLALAWWAPLGSIQVERILPPGPVRAGDTVTIRLRLRAARWWPWFLLRVEDDWEPVVPGASTAAHVFLLSGRQAEVSYRVPRIPRDVYSLRAVRLTACDLFGFIRRQRQVTLPGMIEAWPVPAPVREIRGLLAAAGSSAATLAAQAMTSPATSAGEAHRAAIHAGETRGIRPYAPGDPLRHIHWPATAKTGRLAVREFEPVGRAPLHVVVAAGPSTSGQPTSGGRTAPAGSFEWVLSQAAGVIDWGLEQQRPIALTVGPSHIAAARGQAHVGRLMRLLATCQAVQADTAEPAPMVPGAAVIRVTGEAPS
ncbi:MAG: DUF58 domain-containing protein [Symbiobacteriia bacterium]